MGRAKQLKQMRKIAKGLPKIMVGHVQASVVDGHDLIEKGTTELSNGESVDPKKKYIAKKTVPVPLNHERQMKKALHKGGIKQASQYVSAVIRHDTEKKKAEEEAFKKKQAEIANGDDNKKSAAAQESQPNPSNIENEATSTVLATEEAPGL